MFIMVLTSSLLLVLILIIITIGGFDYYILKKLLYLSEIMERFKRADDSRNIEGKGLGLAIARARDLVNLQGGKFNIDIDGDLFKSTVEFNSYSI